MGSTYSEISNKNGKYELQDTGDLVVEHGKVESRPSYYEKNKGRA
jgi:hypothetical protein